MKRNLVTAEELAAIERVNNDCMKLHLPTPPVAFVGVEVKDANGNLVDAFVMKSNSWVRNAYNVLASQIMMTSPYSIAANYGAGSLQLRDTSGVAVNKGASELNLARESNINSEMGFICSSGIDTNGIVVGTGNTAESFDSYALAAKIANGNASGQMAYNAVVNSGITRTYDSGTKKLTIAAPRIFNNNSGASISVNEVGIYSYGNGGGAGAYLMVSRDLLASPVTVPNGGQLTVTYTVEMTFPG